MDLSEAITHLNWNSSESKQKEAVDFLSKVDTTTLFGIFHQLNKSEWKNYITVVSKINFPDNLPLLPLILELLQDINWPGAIEAIDLISAICSPEVLGLVEKTILKAYQQKDFMWLGGLRILNQKLISNGHIISPSASNLLEFADF